MADITTTTTTAPISKALLDEIVEFSNTEEGMDDFPALGGKWPADEGRYLNHATEAGQALCYKVLASSSKTAGKLNDWLLANDEYPAWRSSGDMKSAAKRYEKRMAEGKDTEAVPRWSDQAKAVRAELRNKQEQVTAEEVPDAEQATAPKGSRPAKRAAKKAAASASK